MSEDNEKVKVSKERGRKRRKNSFWARRRRKTVKVIKKAKLAKKAKELEKLFEKS